MKFIAAHLIALALAVAHAAAADRFADHETLVTDTRKASLQQRGARLRETIATDSAWPHGAWGDTVWCLAALRLNERTGEANARLLASAQRYIALFAADPDSPALTAEQAQQTPWPDLGKFDYTRILCLFHSKSPHYPGRLKSETEAAMKEAMWHWARRTSRVADAGPEDLLLLLGTENHDLVARPDQHLVTALLADDPAYQGRKLADGHTVEEHAAAHTSFFREWPRRRANSGLWVEIGSNGYQKYSWPALFNLHELSPDPVVRHRCGLLMDLALIEEAQISVKGTRGGGRSRADYGPNGFGTMKGMLYGEGGGSSHSRVLESSLYQAPPEAILLHKRAFPSVRPFVIRNRVLGQAEAMKPDDIRGERFAVDSALVNYAWRTPHYLLGSNLQNPLLPYAPISRQNRTCGLLFDDPAVGHLSQIHPVVEHPGGGRSQNSFWSVQHESAMILQRIAHPASYATGRIGMRFDGPDLQKTEEHGWIFASNGKAFVGVKFLDGPHAWDESRIIANPADFSGATDTGRILLQAGDLTSHRSFDHFRESVRSHGLTVTADKVHYRFGKGSKCIEMMRFAADSPANFTLPLIGGKPVDLQPGNVYDSPILEGKFGGDRFTVTVGPLRKTLDFSE